MGKAFDAYQQGRATAGGDDQKYVRQDTSVEEFDLRLQWSALSRSELVDHFLKERKDFSERIEELTTLNTELLDQIKTLRRGGSEAPKVTSNNA